MLDSLSPRERAGVRGNKALAWAAFKHLRKNQSSPVLRQTLRCSNMVVLFACVH